MAKKLTRRQQELQIKMENVKKQKSVVPKEVEREVDSTSFHPYFYQFVRTNIFLYVCQFNLTGSSFE